jgi:putative spermidine/putrescine transport system ATP-binding protein
MQVELKQLQQQLGVTLIFVTHDQEEAMTVSDRIAVMNAGRIDQIGTPSEIYNRPRTRFVASFVGTLNILQARVLDGASGRVAVDDQEIVVSTGLSGITAGETCTLALRPEAVALDMRASERNHLAGTIEEVSFLGSIVRVRVRFRQNSISLDTFNNPGMKLPERDQPVTVSFGREDLLVLDQAVG